MAKSARLNGKLLQTVFSQLRLATVIKLLRRLEPIGRIEPLS